MNEQEIFFEALEIERPEQRAAFLRNACGGNSDLRNQVEALLTEHFGQDSLLARPAIEIAPTLATATSASEGPGTLIGRYKLLQKLGEGGSGAVYMAEQKEPVRRRVAIKLIKLGMDTEQLIARFEAERQALAMMDHPNIARVLDAGSTETGRPYFVMELVKGQKITSFAMSESSPPGNASSWSSRSARPFSTHT